MKLSDKQLIRALYSSWDFQQALSALTFLLEDCDYDKKYSRVQLRRFCCYETALVISLARPFEQTRNGTSISLKALGINLNSGEMALLDKVIHIRRKMVAHSDEEEMHFRAGSFPVFDDELKFPQLQFNEGLALDKAETYQIEALLHKLIAGVAKVIFDVAQHEPERLELHRIPSKLHK